MEYNIEDLKIIPHPCLTCETIGMHGAFGLCYDCIDNMRKKSEERDTI